MQPQPLTSGLAKCSSHTVASNGVPLARGATPAVDARARLMSTKIAGLSVVPVPREREREEYDDQESVAIERSWMIGCERKHPKRMHTSNHKSHRTSKMAVLVMN